MHLIPDSGVSPVDAGYGLVHADTIVATTDDVLRPAEGDEPFRLAVGARGTSGPVADLSLASGVYEAKLTGPGGEESTVRLVLVERSRIRRDFGAHYASLDYDAPVVIGPGLNDAPERKVDWPGLWRTGPHTDVVVDFEASYKLIFWRGTGYVPGWAAGNVLTTNFFAETVEPGVYRDCCEAMSDRECRYSHVRILHSSPARAWIHWRYPLCDADYRICRDYWVDEVLIVYPDGTVVRNCTLHLDPDDPDTWVTCESTGRRIPPPMIGGTPGKRSFSTTEFITVNPPGWSSDDVTPPEAFSLLDTRGFLQTYRWPDVPDFGAEPMPDLEDYIFRMNYRHRPGVFLTTGAAGLQMRFQFGEGMRYMAYPDVSKDWWDRACELPGRFADFIHWPVTRGVWTESLSDPAMYMDRPTHTFLGYAVNHAVEVTDGGAVTWTWFSGIAPADEADLRARAGSWLHAPAIDGARYDARQGAYVIDEPGDSTVLRLPAEGLCRPSFVFSGRATGDVAVRMDGAEIGSRIGVEQSADNTATVVTLDQAISGDTIEFRVGQGS